MCWRLTAALLLAACSTVSRQPGARVVLLGERNRYSFDVGETGWDTFTVPGNLALFQVSNGTLEGAVVGDRGYIWSLNNVYHRNIAVEATVRQTRGSVGNGFGLLCRADAAGNGYYFVISSAGQFAILKAVPGVDDPTPLVAWQSHPAIRQGFEPNTLSIICVDDYLALYANGQFLAETRDSDFDAGALGVVLGATGQTAWVQFDDIRVNDATITGPR
ncbi:MAG: hypothetical protein HZC41_01410 [Chloroflexi bacterium]|nr:hypothetical protein [Chloroflexota bacterium]